MINIAICDDNIEHLSAITSIVQQTKELGIVFIQAFSMWKELLRSCEETIYDIVILDVQMGNSPEGIHAAQELNRKVPMCKIIFLSAYLEYAPEVYDTKHVYFLLKAQMLERLPKVMTKIAENVRLERQQNLCIRRKNDCLYLFNREIIYLERKIRTTFIYSNDEKRYDTTENLDSLQERLSTDHFLRCHTSFLINTDFLYRATRTELTLRGGLSIPVSRKYGKNVLEYLYRR